MKKTPLSLEEHQAVLYEILYVVDDFCKAHDIAYFLVGGTLLGAVRHHGIIPWDDDIDIGMTRDNYERFISLFSKQTPTGYQLYSFDAQHYFSPFAKIAMIDTFCNDNPRIYPKDMGINIDIFPIDSCLDDYSESVSYFQKWNGKMSFAKTCAFNSPKQYFPHWKSRLIYYTHFYYWIFNNTYFVSKTLKEVLYQLSGNRNKKYSAIIAGGLYGKGEVQPSETFQTLSTTRFGTRDLPIPSGWHDYLTGIYGDYMTPPPVEKRKRGHGAQTYRIVQG